MSNNILIINSIDRNLDDSSSFEYTFDFNNQSDKTGNIYKLYKNIKSIFNIIQKY